MYHLFFILSLLIDPLGSFLALAIVNNSTVTIWVHVFFQINVFISPGVDLLGHRVVLFLVFEKSPCWCPQLLCQLTFPPAFMRVLFCVHPCQHLLFAFFSVIAVLTGV